MKEVYGETWYQSDARCCLKFWTQFAMYVTIEAFIFRDYLKQDIIIIFDILLIV
jgi:hypothetical protein